MKTDSQSPRSYRQKARAKAAEETGERILTAFTEQLQNHWFDEIRLEDIASEAGVTVQTVIRRFGGKDGLLEASHVTLRDEILAGRRMPQGDIERALDAIIAEYEKRGPMVMRALAQEDRYEPIRMMADEGRAHHRRWVGEVFAPWLERLSKHERQHAHDRLVIALDLYIWKLMRIDMKRSKADLRRAMLEMAAAALGTSSENLLNSKTPEKSDA